MNYFNRIFRKSLIECPRCLGKGIVDWEDIRRLNKQLKWQPGKCAYCNGLGKVTKDTLTKVKVDNSYLTISLPESEQNHLKKGAKKMLEISNEYERFLDDLIVYIEHHYLVRKMDAESIANSYLEKEHNLFSIEKKDLIDYIEKIIDLKNSEMN